MDQAKIKIIEKNDKSPVTKADLESELLIKKALKKKSSLPIITEESPVAYKIRKKVERVLAN